MPDLKDLRALIKDHQEKDSGLSIDAELCLQTWLIEELNELEADKTQQQHAFDGSMADADTTEIDAQIEAKRAEVDAATITLHFKALTDPKYRDVLRAFPIGQDTTPEQDATFFAELAKVCYRGVNWGGTEFTAAELPWSEIAESVSFGEIVPVQQLVYGLNQRKIDRPFSSRPLKGSRRT